MEGGQVWVKRGEGGTQRDPERGTGGHRRGARARKRAQKRRKDGRGLEVSTPEAGASEEDRGGGDHEGRRGRAPRGAGVAGACLLLLGAVKSPSSRDRHSARPASPGHVAMCPPAAPGTAQSSWGRRGSPTFHRRQSPARAGCGKCAQGHRAEGPQILGGHWPHGWGGGGETGEGADQTSASSASSHRAAQPAAVAHPAAHSPGESPGPGPLPTCWGRARGHSLQESRRAYTCAHLSPSISSKTGHTRTRGDLAAACQPCKMRAVP